MASGFSPGKTQTAQTLPSGPEVKSLPEPALLSTETQANSISIELIRNGNGLTPFSKAGKKL